MSSLVFQALDLRSGQSYCPEAPPRELVAAFLGVLRQILEQGSAELPGAPGAFPTLSLQQMQVLFPGR